MNSPCLSREVRGNGIRLLCCVLLSDHDLRLKSMNVLVLLEELHEIWMEGDRGHTR